MPMTSAPLTLTAFRRLFALTAAGAFSSSFAISAARSFFFNATRTAPLPGRAGLRAGRTATTRALIKLNLAGLLVALVRFDTFAESALRAVGAFFCFSFIFCLSTESLPLGNMTDIVPTVISQKLFNCAFKLLTQFAQRYR